MSSRKIAPKPSLRLWLQLMKCTKTVEAHVGGQLRRKHNQSLARFDVLSQLFRVDGDWATIGEVAEQLMASGGNITGLLDRMESEKLVLRRASPSDRRSYQVKMTPSGRKLFLNMTRDHDKWITDMLADLPGQDKEHLIELLIQVRRAFEPAVDKRSAA